jgi:Excalibur calcium-binding domain
MTRSRFLLAGAAVLATLISSLTAIANPTRSGTTNALRAVSQSEEPVDVTFFAERANVIRRLDLTLASKGFVQSSTEGSFIRFEPEHVNALVTIQDATGTVMLGPLKAGTYYLTFSNPGFYPKRQQVTVDNEHEEVIVAATELQPHPYSSEIGLTWTGNNLAGTTVMIRKDRFIADITLLKPGPYMLAFVGSRTEYLPFWVHERDALTFVAPALGVQAKIDPENARYDLLTAPNLNLVISPTWPEVDLTQPLRPYSPGQTFQASAPPSMSAAVGDLDCRDFPNQETAQAFFDGNGGVGHDRHDLDRDHDGIPCERTEEWAIRKSESRSRVVANIPNAPTPKPTDPTPAVQPIEPSTPAPAATPKQCWVNGYTKRNGTVVAGYWRNC